MRRSFILIGIIVILIFVFIFLKPSKESEFETEVLVENLDTVWAIDFLSDGRIIFTERHGRVSVFDLDSKDIKVVGEIEVTEKSESGLSGIAVDPDFKNNGFVYVYYTSVDAGNRVSRFVLSDDILQNEVVLLDGIPSARFHDGGRIKFGPDGKLYVTTGDATVPSSAQDLDSLAGKLLRMNPDGSVPEDNPFGNYVYSYGHRNSQGIDWDESGKLYEAEHGPTRNDEVNVIVKGGNYGWPTECDEEAAYSSGNIGPIRCFDDFTLAPAAVAFYKGNLYVAGLRGKQIRRIILSADGEIVSEEALFTNLGRIREVISDGEYLYIGTSNRDGRGVPKIGDDKIMRVSL